MRMMSGGDLVVECLRQEGVTHAFSIIGGQMGTMLDAMGRSPDMEVVTPRCEASSPLMACGYTASTGKPSVVLSTVGAGVVYEVAGLYLAWTSYLPVVSIAPQVQSYKMKPHQESLQACNQDELFSPVTKWGAIVYHWDRIPQLVRRAFREAYAPVPGPVHLDIPVDVLFKNGLLYGKKRQRLLPPVQTTRYAGPVPGDSAALDAMAKAVGKAKKPVAVLGQGTGRRGRHAGAGDLLKKMPLPVVTTTASSGTLCGPDTCFAGDSRLFTDSATGRKALGEADCILILGMDPDAARVLSVAQGASARPAVVHVESDPAAFAAPFAGYVPVLADPESALASLSEALASKTFARSGREKAQWRDALIQAGDALALAGAGQARGAQNVFAMLDSALKPEDICVVDGETARAGAACYLRKTACRDLFIMDSESVAGAGLPFTVGCALGNPGARIFLVCDKDSLFHHIREIQPAAALGLDFTIVCLDKSQDRANAADTSAVLQGLGADVRPFDSGPGQDPALIAGFFQNQG